MDSNDEFDIQNSILEGISDLDSDDIITPRQIFLQHIRNGRDAFDKIVSWSV